MRKTILFSLLLAFFTLSAFTQIENEPNPSSLAKGTIITLADGVEVSIEEIMVGDKLLTLNTANTSIAISSVTKINKTKHRKLLKITLANGNELKLTPNQPLLSDKGWVSSDTIATKKLSRYTDLQVLKYSLDSYIYTLSDKIELLPIIDIEEIKEPSDTYSLELENKDASFISNGIFVGQQ